jgi:hypothetical protein
MDQGAFDALTKAMAGGAEPRRTVVRLLTGGALGALLARLGLDEGAEAKQKRGKQNDDKKRSDKLSASGKKHKKHKKREKNKNKDKPPIPPLPPECQNCGHCEMCPDNACVPDPELDGVRCLDAPGDPNGECHVCRNGACVSKCHFQDSICCKGECYSPCGEGKRFDPETCQCRTITCEDDPPPCGVCEWAKCVAGNWVCEETGVGVDCGNSSVCCPVDNPLYSCREGLCCIYGWGGGSGYFCWA